MSDEEVICEFMEPKPTLGPFDMRPWSSLSPKGGWWKAPVDRWWKSPETRRDIPETNVWLPQILTLNELYLIEDRLTDEQWEKYREQMCRMWQRTDGAPVLTQFYLHATANQKIKALAQVLRSVNKKPEGTQ